MTTSDCESDDDDVHNCCICLDSLFRGVGVGGGGDDPDGDPDCDHDDDDDGSTAKGGVGASVPCGHVFHQSCFDRWCAQQQQQQQQYGRSGGHRRTATATPTPICKCPMCNQPSHQFVKLFLDRPLRNNNNRNNNNNKNNYSEDGMDRWDAKMIDTDDPNDATNEKILLQQKAVQYRNKYTAARNNLTKQKTKLQTYQIRVQSMEQEMDRREQDWKTTHEELIRDTTQKQRELERLRLDSVQLLRERDALQCTVHAARERATNLEMELRDVKNGYHEAVRKASAQDMTEVRQILSDYPKKQEENRKLREKISALQRENKEYKTFAIRLSSSQTNKGTTTTTLATTTLAAATKNTTLVETDSTRKQQQQRQALDYTIPFSRGTEGGQKRQPSLSSSSGINSGLGERKRKQDEETQSLLTNANERKKNGPMALLEQESPAHKPVPKPVLINPSSFLLAQKSRVINNHHHEGRSIFLAQKKKRRK